MRPCKAVIADLKAERDDLLEQLQLAQERAHDAAQVMYRRGYLAGYSAGRKAARRRGPYSKTRTIVGGRA